MMFQLFNNLTPYFVTDSQNYLVYKGGKSNSLTMIPSYKIQFYDNLMRHLFNCYHKFTILPYKQTGYDKMIQH